MFQCAIHPLHRQLLYLQSAETIGSHHIGFLARVIIHHPPIEFVWAKVMIAFESIAGAGQAGTMRERDVKLGTKLEGKHVWGSC